MNCEFQSRDGILHVSGELNIYSAAAFRDALLATLAGDPESCLIDCAGVTEIDTAGLQFLLMAKRACNARNMRCEVLAPSAALGEPLDLLDLRADLVAPDTAGSPAAQEISR